MTERLTEDTPCTLCGDPLGMDSGHHVTGERDEKGDPYHVGCLEASLHAETQTELWRLQERFKVLEEVAVEALAFVEIMAASGNWPALTARLRNLNGRLDEARQAV